MKNKSLIRIILMSITFLALAISVVFAEALGGSATSILRIIGIVCGIISLGFYDKKLK